MTTPAFNPIGSLFNSIRYFTQFDPYYYTVDNRPLTDLSSNSTTLGNGVDAARRAILLTTLNENLRVTTENSTSNSYITGLIPSAPSNLTLRIGTGEVLTPLAISSSISQTILKRAVNQNYVDFTFLTPVSNGQSIVYTVEYRYRDINSSTPIGTYFFDASNASLFDTSLNGVIELQLVAGTAASTGSETPPSTTSGWAPIYNIHVSYGASTWYKIYLHANAPKLTKRNFLSKDLSLKIPNSGGGTSVTTYDPVPAWQLAEGSDQSLIAIINLEAEQNTINLYKDIKFDIMYSGSTNTGNYAFQLSYSAISSASALSSISFTNNSVEAIAAPASANALSTSTLTGTIPGSVLNSGAKLIAVKFSRLSSSQTGVDTSTGNMLVTNVTAYQS